MPKTKPSSQTPSSKSTSPSTPSQQQLRSSSTLPLTITLLLQFSLSLALYLNTLAPTITGGDNGELLAEGCTLGTAHPPGYPLFTVLTYLLAYAGRLIDGSSGSGGGGEVGGGRFFTPVIMVNISSAIYGALTSTLIAYTTYILTQHHNNNNNSSSSVFTFTLMRLVTCSIAGGLFTLSPINWIYNTTAEIFALNNFLTTLLITLSVMYHLGCNNSEGKVNKNDGNVYLYTGAVVCGLALSNQHTSILLIVPLVLSLLHSGSLLYPSNHHVLLKCALLFLTTIACFYSTLMIFSNLYHHKGSWGDVSTFKGLVNHFVRKDYGTFQLYSGNGGKKTEGWSERTVWWVWEFWNVQGGKGAVAGVVLVMVGCLVDVFSEVYGWIGGGVSKSKYNNINSSNNTPSSINTHAHNQKYSTLVLLLSLSFYILIFHTLANLPLSNELLYGIHLRFWMQPNISLFIVSGIGLNAGAGFIATHFDRYLSSVSVGGGVGGGGGDDSNSAVKGVFKAVLCLLLTYSTVYVNFSSAYVKSDQSDNHYFKYYAGSILDSIPPPLPPPSNANANATPVDININKANSLMIVNYDQTWTSIRYLQECELVRQDVESVNLSMMVFSWFESKIPLYKVNVNVEKNGKNRSGVTFPGNRYTRQNTNFHHSGGFTFLDLLNSNLAIPSSSSPSQPAALPLSLPGGLYMSGRSNYDERDYLLHYEILPWGLTSRIVNKLDGAWATYEVGTVMPNKLAFANYLTSTRRIWQSTSHTFVTLPDQERWGGDTWESTVRREYFDHLLSRASYILDIVTSTAFPSPADLDRFLPVGESKVGLLLEVALYIELALLHDTHTIQKDYGVYKNLGIAYMHLVKAQTSGGGGVGVFDWLETVNGMRGMLFHEGRYAVDVLIENVIWPSIASTSVETDNDDNNNNLKAKAQTESELRNENDVWKNALTTRWSDIWGHFLQMDGAKKDGSYDGIKSIREQVYKIVSDGQQARSRGEVGSRGEL